MVVCWACTCGFWFVLLNWLFGGVCAPGCRFLVRFTGVFVLGAVLDVLRLVGIAFTSLLVRLLDGFGRLCLLTCGLGV